MGSFLKGKKTITSCIVLGIISVLQYLQLIDESTGKMLFDLATAAGLYGVYDKVKRAD